MAVPHENETIYLNGDVFTLVPGSYQVEDLAAFPAPVRDGRPSYETLAHESVVGWDDWGDGFAEVTYRNPTRYYYSTGVDASTPYQLLLGPLQSTTAGVTEAPTVIRQLLAGGAVAGVSNTNLWLKSTSAETWTSHLGNTPRDLLAWGNSSGETLYLAACASNAYQYSTLADFSSWTASDLGGSSQVADFWAQGNASTNAGGGSLWKARLPNLVQASANPRVAADSGAWTSPYRVGGSHTNITALAFYDNRLLVGKEDGLYWVKPDGTVELLIDMSGAVWSDNCKHMVAWNGYLFVPWVHGLYIFSGGNLLNVGEVTASFRDVGPNVNVSNASAVRGRVVAMAASPTRLYLCLRSEADQYHILSYNGDPRAGFGFHPIASLGANTCNALGWEQPASSNPRLYFGYGTAVRYLTMPRYADNPALDSNYRYVAQGTLELAEYESRLRAMTKCFLYVTIDLENTSTGARYVDISYSVDGAAFTTLRRVDADGLTKCYFSTNVTGRRIRLRLTLATNDSSISPRVRLVELHYELRPDRRQRWRFSAVAATGTRTHPTRTGKATRDKLVAARDSSVPVSFEDRFGTLWDVFVEAVGEVEIAKLPGTPEPAAAVPVVAKEFKSGVGAYYTDTEQALVGSAYAA